MKKEIKVLCGGCFNTIHPGHIYFLKKAKSFGHKLIVVLANDVNNKKPYAIPVKKRKKMLESLNIADKVVVGDEKDFMKVIRKEKPDIIALGYDQHIRIKNFNGKIVRIKKYKQYSSKNFI